MEAEHYGYPCRIKILLSRRKYFWCIAINRTMGMWKNALNKPPTLWKCWNEKEICLLKISLFGESSTETIHKKVKLEYLSQILPDKSNAISNTIDKIKNIVPFIKKTHIGGDVASAVISLDPTDFIEVKNQLNKRKIILIFDDLERCNINTIDLLGCINDYCENKSIKVIIVANEDKLKQFKDSESQSIQYGTIKEKLIARTVHYEPQYDQIIGEIIASFKAQPVEYKAFLEKNQAKICNVFNKGNIKNLRSLKCCIQDFQRIYQVFINANYMSKIDETFISFLIYTLELKAGNIKTSPECVDLPNTSKISNNYSEIFNDKFLLPSIREWLVSGKWDEERLNAEIAERIVQEQPMKAKDKIKCNFLLDLDDDTIKEGFLEFINEAYTGMISLNDYILFIQNLSFARKINYNFPIDIDYDKLEIGLKECFNSLNKDDNGDSTVRTIINEEDLKFLNPHEKQLYNKIKEYRDENIQVYESNKSHYLNALKEGSSNQLLDCENKIYKALDEEISNAVFDYYQQMPSGNRRYFLGDFSRMWKSNMQFPGLSIEATRSGLETLLSKITLLKRESLLEKYVDKMFITTIKDLLSMLPAQKN